MMHVYWQADASEINNLNIVLNDKVSKYELNKNVSIEVKALTSG